MSHTHPPPPAVAHPVDIAVFVSGTGRLLQELIERSGMPGSAYRVAAVVASNPHALALGRATQARIETAVISSKTHGSSAARDDAITEFLHRRAITYAVLAGYLAYFHVPPGLHHRVLNIHPALLPGFGGKGYYGHRVHEAVLASGVQFSGCTVHLVDDQYDHGPIVVQRVVPVKPDDTADSLAARVFEQEREALPAAVDWLVQGRLRVTGRRVLVCDQDKLQMPA